MWEAKTPLRRLAASSGATSLRESDRAAIATSSGVAPAASAAPITAPMDVATMWVSSPPASQMAFQAPTWAMALAPPPEKTATTRTATPPNAEVGTRNAEQNWKVVPLELPAPVPPSAFRVPRFSFPRSRIVSPIHHPARAPFRRSLEAPLLVRGLGHDRRDLCRPAVVVQRDVGDVARIRMSPLAREHVLRDDLHAHLHRRATGVVDPRVSREQLAHVDRLLEVHLVHRYGDARLAGVADRGYGGHPVHQRQDHAAEHVAHDVRVLRHHQLRHDGLGLARMACLPQ